MTNRLIPTNAEPLYRQLMARIRDDVSSGGIRRKARFRPSRRCVRAMVSAA